MISALISFLGGSAFRMIFGSVSDWFDKRQEHQHEVERMKVQADLDKQRHEQDCERLRLQSDLGVNEVMIQGDVDIAKLETDAFVQAMKTANQPTGIKWVDVWNGIIRPLVATICVLLWVMALNEAGWKMGDWDKEIVGVVFGFFFASRELAKRKQGKV